MVEDTAAKSATLQLSVQAAQTITPGTNDKTIAAGLYLTGTQTIKGDANLVAGNIKSGVTIFGVSGEYGGGAADAPTVTQPAPTVSVNSSTGLVTADYAPVAGLVNDTAVKSATLQLTVQAAQTITPGTNDKTIAAGLYLTGTQTIKGDANLVAGNIKSGVTIFGVSGEYGGGAADAPTVTQPAPTVSVNSSTGLVTATYTPVAGLVEDTAVKSATLQLTVQAAKTITPGTGNQTVAAGKYLTGKLTVKGDANLVAGNIKKGVTIFNVAGSYEASGGTVTIPDTTATEKTLLQGYTAVVKDSSSGTGYKTITGNVRMATSAELKSTPRIDTYNDNYAADVEISGKGAECNVLGRVVRENHVQLEPVGGANIIMQSGVPGAIEPPLPHIDTLEGADAVCVSLIPVPLKDKDADPPEVSIRGPLYVHDNITVLLQMDPAFQAENIKKGVVMWGVAGTYSGGDGGGGANDLVAVTSYTPAYADITSLQLSGMSDFSDANGTYAVTAETASLPADKKVFKHSDANYYITYLPESTDGMYYSYGWCLASTPTVSNSWSALVIGPKNLVSGTSQWADEMGMTSQYVTISDIQSTEVPAEIKFKRVTGYSSSTLQYTLADAEESCSESEYSVQEHQIYSFDGTSLVGRPVDCAGGSHLRTYIPGRTEPVTLPQKSERSNSTDGYYFSAWQYPSFHTSSPERFSLATRDEKSCIFSNADAVGISLWDRDIYATGKFGYYPSNANRYWSFGALLNSGGNKYKKQILEVRLDNVARVHINVDWTASTPQATLHVNSGGEYSDGNVVATFSHADLIYGWHHFLMTYNFDTKTLTMYVDGVARGTHTVTLERTGYYDGVWPYVGIDRGEFYIGHVCEIKFWDVPLTAEQAMAEYTRAINS